MPQKLSVPLRLAALEPPSKSYANRIVQSFFVQLSRNLGNYKADEDRYSPCPYLLNPGLHCLLIRALFLQAKSDQSALDVHARAFS